MSGRSSCTRVDPCGVPTYCPLLQISMVIYSDEFPLLGVVFVLPC